MSRPRLGAEPLTATERSARRNERQRLAIAALEVIRDEVRTLEQARRIAREALASLPVVKSWHGV